MEVARLYLDANVIIALGEGKGEIAHLLTELAAAEPVRDTPFLCTSELTLAEVLVHPHRQANDELIDLYDGWLNSTDWLEIGPVHRPVLQNAAVLRSQYQTMKLPDAIHLSTAIGMRCSHILTADNRIPDEVELTHRRYGIAKGPARVRRVGLEAETLRSIISTLAQA